MTHFLSLRRGLGVALATMVLVACSSKPKNLQGDCRTQFAKLDAQFQKKKYASAKEGLSDFTTTCAGTEHAEQAEFELCESHFALQEWMEAEEEYSSFLKDFPGSKQEELARYRLAQSMANQAGSPQRDQSKTVDAIHEFETYLADYPESPHSDSAKSELDRLHKLLAARDMGIAHLYLRMGEPLAAAIYYKHILNQYGDRVPQREIILKLVNCYIELQQFNEAETQLTRLDGVPKDDPFLGKVKAMHKKLEKAETRYAREKKAEKEEEAQKPRAL